METRKESLSTLKLCRFCLATDESLIPLYNKVKAPKNSVPFALKILACIAIEIFPSDRMPQYICQRCKLFIELSYAFKQLCRQADEAILQYIQTGAPLAPMPWPTQLNKVHKAYSKSTEDNVVKTVVQGGATIKVMTEEISDSEEGEDDNVYNVKIADGPETGKSIKIITSVEDKPEQSGKKPRQGIAKNSEDADNTEVGVVEARCWPCDQCECTYPLEQLLELHKAQKHRVRNEMCEECGGKFFSKYDLITHQLTHTTEMAFQCVACDKKFKRLILLKRHEKIMHSELPQHSCLNCPATFLSVEELEVHQQRHDRHTVRPFSCYICNKKFHDKTILHRHTTLVHNKKPAFSCQYCPEQFPSVSKLTRHVREHAGVRPYPCKHCDKSFMKSHHYTRHLRLKHSESTRTAGPYNESDAYHCEECEETFGSQDELMYHSALHATTNLTCPLCQEKFQDVDTVTAHIKSHVSGAEYMCDFCELIFTSKDKLDVHMTRVHDEELLANDQDTEHDESSMDMDAEEDEDSSSLNVKEEDGHMVVEIRNENQYTLPAAAQVDEEDKTDNNQSEDSDVANTDSPPTEMEVLPTPKKQVIVLKQTTLNKVPDVAAKEVRGKVDVMRNQGRINQTNILRKAEEIKRKVTAAQQQVQPTPDKKEKVSKVESTTALGASDKSLRLLEKELQDLKRTNTRVEVVKTPFKSIESLRNRRPLLHSTPKIRPLDKKEGIAPKSAPEKVTLDKKLLERKISKDPKDIKEIKSNNNTIKEDRELKLNSKDDKEDRNEKEKEDKKEKGKEDRNEKEREEKKEKVKEDRKEKETPKIIKNGATETPSPVVGEPVRRSSRPSKFKDYAKMIRDSSMNSDDNDSEEESEEYSEQDKTPETTQVRNRRGSNKQTAPVTPASASKASAPVIAAKASTSATVVKQATPVATAKQGVPVAAASSETLTTCASSAQPAAPPKQATLAPRKRGRPRKEQPQTVVPNKIKRDEPSEEEIEAEPPKANAPAQSPAPRTSPPKEDALKENEPGNIPEGMKTPEINKVPLEPTPSSVMISPSGQTLKKVPIRALPPGVKPLPLPVNSRLSGGEVCEMQIGKKMVKVQKIVMTKAEVEAMAKKGLVEMKDGTMVLKQGIKLPGADPASLKSTLVGDGEKKEPPLRAERPAPTRCDLDG